jgi:hypothetical protein
MFPMLLQHEADLASDVEKLHSDHRTLAAHLGDVERTVGAVLKFTIPSGMPLIVTHSRMPWATVPVGRENSASRFSAAGNRPGPDRRAIGPRPDEWSIGEAPGARVPFRRRGAAVRQGHRSGTR